MRPNPSPISSEAISGGTSALDRKDARVEAFAGKDRIRPWHTQPLPDSPLPLAAAANTETDRMLLMPSQASLAAIPRQRRGQTKKLEQFQAGDHVRQYQLIRELGRGGMGVVYLARDTKLARRVAIKFLLPDHPSSVARFMTEARTTARCRHENIVVIHDVDEYRQVPFMVLEYLQGQPLTQLIADGPHSPQRAVELMIPVVRALKCAHAHGIVHRDLKPGNIFLTKAGTIKVLDFGVAKLMAESMAHRDDHADSGRIALYEAAEERQVTRSGALVGTWPYASPEQLRGEDVDHQADIWSVGIVLYKLVTGRHPLAPLSEAKIHILSSLHRPMPSAHDAGVAMPGKLADIIDRCLLKDPADRTATAAELLTELEALVDSRRPVELCTDESPFAGLAAFQEADAGRFFGRAHDAAAVVSHIKSHPLVAVIGPSGAGKSSLIRAGVIPALKRSGEGWDTYIIRPGCHPLAALASITELRLGSPTASAVSGELPMAMAKETSTEHTGVIDRLRAEPGYLGLTLRARATRKRRRALLFIDQFEELYTLCASREERAAFVTCLVGVADDPASPLRVVLSIRSDFLDRMAEDRELMTQVMLTVVPPMGRRALREALVEPVEAAGFRFDSPTLVEGMLDALEATSGALPLLQFTATKLWERRDRTRRLLTEASYREIGGVAGALATHADSVLAGMTPRQQALVRAIFERLVTPERTRALVSLRELCELTQDADSLEEVVHHLARMRLIMIETVAGNTNVELVHESLIREWPTFGRWLDENQDDAAFVARVRAAASQWAQSGHHEGHLWRGEPAQEAERWHERHVKTGVQGIIGPREERYLTAVLALEERARWQRWRIALSAVLVLCAVAMVLAYLTVRAKDAALLAEKEEARAEYQAARAEFEAARAEKEATRARQEATSARNALRLAAAELQKDDPTTVVALLRELDPGELPLGWSSLARWALATGVARAVIEHSDSVLTAVFSPDGRRIASGSRDGLVWLWRADGTGAPTIFRAHDAEVWSVAFSPDNTRLASGSWDTTVRVWPVDGTGEPTILRGHDAEVSSVAFHPDGSRIVSASGDKTIRVWPANGQGEPLVLRGHQGQVRCAVFSPDGTRIASGGADKTVRIWRADGKGLPLVLRGHEGGVLAVRFSPDGSRVASASSDKTVRIWNVKQPGLPPLVLRGHESQVWSVEFSPDNSRIVSSSWDNTVRIWPSDGRMPPVVLRGHSAAIYSAVFSPDGRRILSASWDRTVRIWNAEEARDTMVLRGHEGKIRGVTVSPDGSRIASAAADNTLRIWRADGQGDSLVLRGHTARVLSVAYSPDGTRIVSASADNTIRIWPADGQGEPLVLRGHTGEVWSAVFSPDGSRIASAALDDTVRIWRADGQGEPLVLRGHKAQVLDVVFSPDGSRVASSSIDHKVHIWNADGTGAPLVLSGHSAEVMSVAFSPDGSRIASGAGDKTVRVWRADGTGEPTILRGHHAEVIAVAFSPDGSRIVSASDDRIVRIWRADGAGAPLLLRGHEGSVGAVAFSPDGQRIISGSEDKTVRVWRIPEPLLPNDPQLWTATSHCLSVERRQVLLGMTEEIARADYQRCLSRVMQLQASSASARL